MVEEEEAPEQQPEEEKQELAQPEEDEQVHFDDKPIVESSPQVEPVKEGEENKHEEITDSNLKAELAEFEAGQQTINGQTIVTEGDEIQPVLAATSESSSAQPVVLDNETILREARATKPLIDGDFFIPESLRDKEDTTIFLSELTSALVNNIMINEEFIDSQSKTFPEADKLVGNLGKEPFAISKSTRNTSIEFLLDYDVPLEQWIGELDNEKVKKTLRIWFSLQPRYNKEDWCTLPGILDDEQFLQGAKLVLI